MNASKQGLIISNIDSAHWRGQFVCWFIDHDIPGCVSKSKRAGSKYKYELSDCLI